MKWGANVANTCTKSSQVLGFLRRNLNDAPKKAKLIAYRSLVRSRLEYAACATDPYFRKDVDALEKVQRRGIRFVCGRYKWNDGTSVTELLKSCKLDTLESRREQSRHKMLAKICMGSASVQHLCCAAAIAPVNPMTLGFDFYSRSVSVLDADARRDLVTNQRAVCSCKMTDQPRMVIDPLFRVWGWVPEGCPP